VELSDIAVESQPRRHIAVASRVVDSPVADSTVAADSAADAGNR
jgi:hypothetical protein